MNKSLEDMALRLCGRNPGATTLVAQLMNTVEGMAILIWCDKLKIYGPSLYLLWNDCCDRNIEKVKDVIRAYEAGTLTKEEILDNVTQSYGKPFNV